MSILAVLEHRSGAWNRLSWETLAAARQLAEGLKTTACAAILGSDLESLAVKAAAKPLDRLYLVEHAQLRQYTPDAYTLALRQLLAVVQPEYVLLPHTYQVRDFLPKLAASLGTMAVADAVALRVDTGQVVAVRQLFQGKVHADVRFSGPAPHFISLQAGAFRAPAGEGSAAVEKFSPTIAPGDVRTVPSEPFRESARAVDLSAADLIVAVGRGIKDADNISLIRDLAAAMGAELGASRPICDAGWLPMERQVGSSGQTVAPKLYVAVGISGAIQHLVGMKGARTIVAINKDPNAPIFEVADYGITGDLFQVVPEIIAALKKENPT